MTQPPQPQDSPDIAVTATEAIDGTRVDQRAESLFPALFWNAYKGHNRGGLTGIVLGGGVGLFMALAICATPFVGLAMLPAVGAALAATGAIMGWEGLGAAGAAAATRAAGLAEKHARFNDPMYRNDMMGALNDRLMVDGRSHHYEYPRERDDGKFFYWKSGAVGAAAGGAVGGLLGLAQIFGAQAGLTAVTAGGHGMAAILGGAAGLPIVAALGPVATLGLLGVLGGSTFGIARSIYKSILNQSDALLQGHVKGLKEGEDLGREQFAGKENDKELLQHRIRRQEEIGDLEKAYGKRIFQGGIHGYVRGMVGGSAAGLLSGIAVGILASAAIFLTAGAAAGALPALAAGIAASGGVVTLSHLVIGGFAAAGAAVGMGIFSQAGTEAGTESTTRAIGEEFQRNRLLKIQGATLPPPRQAPPVWVNGKAALTMGVAGLLLGPVLAPALLPHLALLGITHTMSAAAIATCSAGIGTMGALFGGAGSSLLKRVSNGADWLYDKSYVTYDDPKPQPAAPVPKTPVTPGHGMDVTPDDIARLNERLNAPSTRGFAQTVQQQAVQSQVPGLAAGV